MKISTASKKVLASALSAAMVVAFAPAAAFGQVVPGDQVTVKFDTTGLTVKSMNSEFDADGYAAGVNVDNKLALPAAATSGHEYMFDASTAVAGWYFDADDDGKYDATKDITLDGGALDFTKASNLVNAGNTITLKPFKAVAAGVSVADITTVKQAYSAGSDTFTLNLSNTKEAAVENLRVSIAKDGAEIAYALTDIQAATTDQSGKVTAGTDKVEFGVVSKDATSKAAGEIKASDLGKGKYTVTVSDAASLKAVATSEFEVVSVHADGLFDSAKDKTSDKVGQDILMVAGQPVEDQLNAAAEEIDVRAAKAKADGKSYEDAVAYKVGDKKAVEYEASNGSGSWAMASGLASSVKVAADTVLTPLYGDAAVMGDLSIDDELKKLTASVDYPKAGAEYDFELTGPATASKTVKPNNAESSADTDEVELFAFDSNGAKAGKYTVTATQVENRGTNAEKKTVVGTSSLTLTQLTYDAGEGKLAEGVAAGKIVKAGTKWSKAELPANTNSSTSVKAPEGKRFVGWSTDGATVVAANDKIGEEATTLKAVYAADAAAAPSFSYADGKLTLANEAGAGYDVVYGTSKDNNGGIQNAVTYSSPITVDVDKVEKIYIQTVKKSTTTGLGNSAVVEVTNYKGSAKSAKDWAKTALAGTTGASTAAAPQYYSDVLKTAADDAEAAVKALNYGTAKDWAKAELAQETAVLQAIADYESGQIDAYVAGVTAADGSMKKLAASTAAEKKADIAKVIEDFGFNNDGDAKTVASKTYTNASVSTEYVKAIADASKAAASAATKYEKADVDAAKAVSDKVAKLAADYAEVTRDNYEAAIDAAIDAQSDYAALSADAKSLVSADAQEAIAKVLADAATVAGLVKDEEAAQKLADAQDLAAARQLYSKTVTAKAKAGKKAQGKSFTYKLAASESGATATYAKASGSKYIKVSKSGKVTFSKVKVSKKAKTYKAKVTVTYGTQSATKTVTYKVVKK